MLVIQFLVTRVRDYNIIICLYTVTIPRVNIIAVIYTPFVLIENVQLFVPKGPDILSISHEVLRWSIYGGWVITINQ